MSITPELCRTLSELSHDIRKNISLVINRKGKVEVVYLGEVHEIPFDKLIGRSREAKYRLRGFRVFQTHLKSHALSRTDLVTLVNERLDLIGAIEVADEGIPGRLQMAHVLPPNPVGDLWQIIDFTDIGQVDIVFDEFVDSLEGEIERAYRQYGGREEREGVFLVGFSAFSRTEAEERLIELKELAGSAGKVVLGQTVQFKKRPDPRYVVGKGKLEDIILSAKQAGAETLIFDLELSPSQVKAISNQTNLYVMDRTQLILEIFASRATTSEGKLQVQLAQLRYALPRLAGHGRELSQLGGGIGTRGPGEKKLEEQRRVLRKRVDDLEKQIDNISKRRERSRKQRKETGIPSVTLIGYTSVGKSTLFNTLTKSDVFVARKLFSTLSPTTRKIMLPGGSEVLITDTVGFIRDLPKELVKAFRATLEELGESSFLLHIADASDPNVSEKIESVEQILQEYGFGDIPELLVFNKGDKISPEERLNISSLYNSPIISAFDKNTFDEFLGSFESLITSGHLPTSPAAVGDTRGSVRGRV